MTQALLTNISGMGAGVFEERVHGGAVLDDEHGPRQSVLRDEHGDSKRLHADVQTYTFFVVSLRYTLTQKTFRLGRW